MAHPLARTAAVAVAVAGTLLICVVPSGRELTVPVPRGLELFAPTPANNTPTDARVELGRRLFSDRALSADRSVSCASCHRPDHVFADDVPASPGVYGRRGRRNTPSLLNVAYARHLTWDGRSSTLEEQVLKPIQDSVEMDLSLDELVARLGSQDEYRTEFRRAYGEPVSADGVARALSAFLRTLRSGDAPLDRHRAGDPGALSDSAGAGFQLFVGKARCWLCHAGPTLTDGDFHNTGVAARSGSDDLGRFTHSRDPTDLRAFRTASLRNVDRTAPYMHDGSFGTLEQVIDFYDEGGGPDALRDVDVRPLNLSPQEKSQLAAFLRSLSGT